MRRIVSGIMLMLFLVSMLAFTYNIQPVNTESSTIVVPDDYPALQEAANMHTPHIHGSSCRDNYFRACGSNVPKTWNQDHFSPGARFSRFMDSNLPTVLCQDEDSAEIIIGVKTAFNGNYEKIRTLISGNNGKIINTILMKGKPQAVVADVPHEALSSLKWKMLNEGLARYVEPNMRLRSAAVPNDPEWHLNWGLDNIKAEYAWNTTTGEPSLVIAVVDTGVDWNHPDLANNIWNNTDEWIDGEDNDENGFVDDIRGWDFVDTAGSVWPGEDGTERDNDPMDFYGHGTHCAGIASAVGNNSIGVAGVTWNCKIMPVRAGYKGADGGGYLELDDAAAAVIYAADNHAHIISCSWGGYYNSQIIRQAVKYAYDAGVVLVAAAGNELTDEKLYPAAYEEAMAISATTEQDWAAVFSNFGYWVELAAPGDEIYSTIFNDSYDYMSGTSMATPFVAGVAALVWSRFPSMNRDQVRAQLRFTSDDLGEVGFDVRFGYGRANAKEAVELEQEAHDLAIFEMNIDSIGVVGEPFYVDVTVLNMGTLDEHNVIVQFLVNSSLIKSENVMHLASGELKSIHFLWNTSECLEGYYNLTAYVVPVGGENSTGNNCLSKKKFVRYPRIINVPQDCVSIQEAIDEALEGDTIMVASGTYGENVFIYKDFLKLIGEDAATTIIDGWIGGDVILVWGVDHVEIHNFTVRNGWWGSAREQPFSGVLIHHSQNVKVINVLAEKNEGGIFLYCSDNVTLKENHMKGNKFNFGIDGVELSNFIHWIDESNIVEQEPLRYLMNESNRTVSAGAGCIIVVNSTGIDVKSIGLADNYAGILCVGSTNVTIVDLEVSSNYFGVYILSSVSIIVRNTNVTQNRVGIHVKNSEKVTVENNFVSTPYGISDGIKIHHSTKCQARSNVLTRNHVNLWLYYSNENTVTNNNVSSAWSSGILLTNAHNNLLRENWLFDNVENLVGDGVALNTETSFKNSIYHNNFINNTFDVFTIDSVNIFDNGYPSGGNYWDGFADIDLYSGPFQNETGADGIGDIPCVIDEDNRDHYPLMNLYPCVHALAVKNARSGKTVIGQGFTAKIYVGVTNLGHFTENFNVTVYIDSIIIDTSANIILTSGNSVTITFTWNTTGLAKGNYTIWTYATQVLGETDTTDNVLTGWVIVAIVGDITGPEGYPDGKCDIKDVAMVAKLFGVNYPDPRYDANCDLTGQMPSVPDGKIDIKDVATVAKHYAETNP